PDSPPLHHLPGVLGPAVRACGAHLGGASGRYGSGDIADDIDAIRAALGIDKIDFYGGSFSAHNVRAYAYRHPDHLQSAVFDSPWLSQDYAFQASNARFYAQVQATVCRRSPSCFGANPDPEKNLAWLARRLRERPARGNGTDAHALPHTTPVDASPILDILSAPEPADPPFLNQGELTAAARALQGGDTVPLLRLAAESPQSTDSGDPGFFSAGASVAKFCSDGRLPYATSPPHPPPPPHSPPPPPPPPPRGAACAVVRPAAGRGEGGRRPRGGRGGSPPGGGARGPPPVAPTPPSPPTQPFPNTPTLILNSDLDVVSLDDTKANLPLFPN